MEGTPGVQSRTGGAGDALRALAALCVHVQTKADV